MRLCFFRHLSGLPFALAALSVASVTHAAAPASPASTEAAGDPEEVQQMEKMVITGSSIPLAIDETFAPVTRFSSNDFARAGAGNAIEAVRDLPGFIGNVSTERATNGGTGAAGVNLRGLDGALTLLNGHRTAGFADFNLLPLIAIDRVEIVKDGASSVYGADALAGVFNVILVQSYQGAKLDLYYGNTTDKDAGVIRAGFLVGAGQGKTNIVIAAEYYHRNSLTSADRNVSKYSDDRPWGGLNQGSGSFSGRTTARTSPTGPVQDLVLKPGLTVGNSASDFVPFDPNSTTSNQFFNTRLYSPSIPAANRGSVYSRINQTLTSTIDAWASLLYTHSAFYDGLAAAPMPSTGSAGTTLRNAIRSSPDVPTGLIVTGTTSDVSPGGLQIGSTPFRTIVLGNRLQTYVRDSYDLSAGLTGRIAGEWTWDARYVYSQLYRDDIQSGAPSLSKLSASILSGAYNPFALDSASGVSAVSGLPYDNPKALREAAGSAKTDRENDSRSGAAKVVGPVVDLPTGKIILAVGADYRRDDVDVFPNPIFFTGDLLGLNANNPSISRAFDRGLFAETIVPLLSPAQNIPGVQSLSLTLSERRDLQRVEGYDGGSTGNPLRKTFSANSPKIGVRYQPTEDLLLRGTWAKGFLLPSLSQLFAAKASSNPALTDPLGFPIANTTPITTQGNPDLNPEKSRTWSAGVVYTPKAISGLSLSADYYSGEITGLVGEGAQYILNVNAAGQGAGFVPGNPATINPSAPFASRITRSASGNVTGVTSATFNISSRKTTGIDSTAVYTWPWRTLGTWTTGADWNTVLTWDLIPVQGLPKQNWLGRFVDVAVNGISPGSIPRQRGKIYQVWKKSGWRASFTMNYISHLEDDTNRTLGHVPRYVASWTTFDTQLEYTFKSPLDRLGPTTVRVGATNLTNVGAPFAAGGFNDSYDTTTYSDRGRFVYTELVQKF